MKVLLVDDDLINCEILSSALTDMSFDVTCSYDGGQAIAELSRSDYRLVVCDWEMPIVDGPALCRWIRSRVGAPPTYIIMLTSRKGLENTADALDSGADTFLSKPCEPAVLIDYLRLGERLLSMETLPGRR